eukprot:CAMPEP_0117454562 /NCGR_PEP_ID=MMETSP0759-20121206/10864_1 /TAXON_ID=63605 /ORGANISM="Percolomonas cosmopolitus, Strain WS" /LENGTH=641 /DNA_ID=CAMNT_0005247751 /DNA_START=2277 /DNA_END=4202 /DNA_ORIENTATION=+
MSRIFGLSNQPKPTLTDSFLNDLILKKKQSIHNKFQQFADNEYSQVIRRSVLETYLEEECGLDTKYDHLRQLLDYYCTLGSHNGGGANAAGNAGFSESDMGMGTPLTAQTPYTIGGLEGSHQHQSPMRSVDTGRRVNRRESFVATTPSSPQAQQRTRIPHSPPPQRSQDEETNNMDTAADSSEYYQSNHNFSTITSPSTTSTLFSPSPKEANANQNTSVKSAQEGGASSREPQNQSLPQSEQHPQDPPHPQSTLTRDHLQKHNAHLHHQFHQELEYSEHHRLDTINMFQFTKLLTDKNIIQKAIDHELAIPHFGEFVEDVIKICKESERVQEGKVPTYIPELKNVDPQDFAVSICTVDGQQFSYGDSDVEFTLQAAVLPLVYCLALEQLGKKVKDYIGREPSGARFNDFVLTEDKKPHNALVSTGGILTCSLIEPKEPSRASERFGKIHSLLLSMSASKQISFNQRVYLSEKSHADRNAALAYYMRGQGVAGMEGNNIADILDFYYQCCSIATTTKVLAQCGSTLANAGVNCFTKERVLKSSTVRQTLSIMYTCGLADSSGEWAFQIGLPAKSGIAGGMMVVVPNVCGITVYSPKVNEGGHSVRAIDFLKRLVSKFSFSIFDQLVDGIVTSKSDPTMPHES